MNSSDWFNQNCLIVSIAINPNHRLLEAPTIYMRVYKYIYTNLLFKMKWFSEGRKYHKMYVVFLFVCCMSY